MIAIIKYNGGNTMSVMNAVKKLGYDPIVTDDAETILQADKVILPGVGEASSAMKSLQASKLDTLLKNLKQPVLGICLGMQLMCDHSEENDTPGLGIFKTLVKKFPTGAVVPHMGWNDLQAAPDAWFGGSLQIDDVYFVHSYYAEVNENTVATCDYILPFSAAMQKDNFYGTQFHPEKSGETGSQILKQFLNL
jgi:glutamine amidotransferase